LAQQALERARDLFDLPAGAFGMVGDGKDRLGTHLTVATVQTLARRELEELAGRFGVVVLDEAHHAPAASFVNVLQAFPARYRLGLTATPDRADGLGGAMLAVLGPAAARLTTADLAAAGRVLVPTVRQAAFRYRYRDDFAALLAALCADPARNGLIAATVAAEARAGHRCLVLSERVEHCHLLAEALAAAAPAAPAAVLTGTVPPKRRAEALEALRSGRLRVLLATKLADEGLDLPALERLFLATGGRAAGRLQQQLGRVMRSPPGKAAPVVFDFVDPLVGVLAAQACAGRSPGPPAAPSSRRRRRRPACARCPWSPRRWPRYGSRGRRWPTGTAARSRRPGGSSPPPRAARPGRVRRTCPCTPCATPRQACS